MVLLLLVVVVGSFHDVVCLTVCLDVISQSICFVALPVRRLDCESFTVAVTVRDITYTPFKIYNISMDNSSVVGEEETILSFPSSYLLLLQILGAALNRFSRNYLSAPNGSIYSFT